MSEVTFEPFQRVLVRDFECNTWQPALYGYRENSAHPYRTLNGVRWIHCIPYEGNEHLLGTTNSPTPPEPEFKWGDHVEAKLADGYEWEKAIYCFKEKEKFVCLYTDSFTRNASYCRHANW